MRGFGLSVALNLWALATAFGASAFEIEDERLFPADGPTLSILSTADLDIFTPILEGFQAENPGVAIRYVVASSAETMKAVAEEGAEFDVVISSAMDLQTKLANDGFAVPHESAATALLPDWARWRDQVFAFSQEPAVLVIARDRLGGAEPPRTRAELIDLLRADPDRFAGRVGTYDVRVSGLGYLFATQDSRISGAYWRLMEVMGRLGARLYCCSSRMIDGVAEGRLDLAYNVLGSYAARRLAGREDVEIIRLADSTHLMLRTALIPKGAANEAAARAMIDFLAKLGARPDLAKASGLAPVSGEAISGNPALRPIRLGPGLLVFLDTLRRRSFLRSWTDAMEQGG